MDNWARNIKDGIDIYNGEVTMMYNEGFPEVAGMEIDNAIFALEQGYNDMPIGTTKAYALGLIARFKMFREYCLNEEFEPTEKNEKVNRVIDMIDERIHLVELGTNPFLKDNSAPE